MHLFLLLCVLLPALLKADTQCKSQSGACKYTSQSCSGEFWPGKCSGPSNRQCCIPGSLRGDSACVNTHKGYCQTNTRTCGGSRMYLSGKCAGARNRQCCAPKSTPSSGTLKKVVQICQGNLNNDKRGCDIKKYGCGHYGASRDGGTRTHDGVDVKCSGGAEVYAPFPATYIRISKPYKTNKCCNTGMLLRGVGAWKGYEAKLWYNQPIIKVGDSVSAGDRIATHISLHCSSCYDTRMTDHTHFELRRNRVLINPTNML